jgi:phosphocarrier protein
MSNEEMTRRTSFVIQNRLGLHARAAALFVQSITPLDADVFVSKDGQTVNGKSIMGLMMLAAGKGSSIDVEANGPDADRALQTIGDLIDSRFREEE